ncbi:hypothetical protein [Neobacillus terrae]|uniref:hypothetical protein n=1 Tax=Neobacillus terrae TaxID=3034837 RepID=UPI00140CEA18|nr:hypothetical protein [Neobacillus terrae]NHM31899.1 hypothetical protein [Neobacillus terrae]
MSKMKWIFTKVEREIKIMDSSVVENNEKIGSVFLIEALDTEEAIRKYRKSSDSLLYSE